jgi:hypothetical protein
MMMTKELAGLAALPFIFTNRQYHQQQRHYTKVVFYGVFCIDHQRHQ